MAELTVLARSAAVTFATPEAGGDSFRNDGATELHIINATGSDVTLTVTAQGRCKHGFLDDEVEVIESGGYERFGPYAAGRFNDSSGLVQFSLSAQTGIEVAAQRQR